MVAMTMGVFLLTAVEPDSALVAALKSTAVRWGVPTAVIFGLILLATHFGLIAKGSIYFWKAVSWVYRRFNRRKLQREVRTRVNEFLDHVVFRRLVGTARPEVHVEFVHSANEVREHADGRVIVRMREDRDQDLNVLLALATAVTQVFHPSIRGYLSKTTQSAVDLQIVSELATRINDRARRLFQAHLLEPKLREDARLAEAIHQLHEVADAGLFEAVLIQELQQLSDRHVQRPPAGLGPEVDDYIRWLHLLATREVGDESVDLAFIRANVRTGMLLAAKKTTAMKGTEPYRRRTRRTLFKGARQLYLLGLSRRHGSFVDEIAEGIVDDGWATLEKSVNITRRKDPSEGALRLVMFRRDEVRFSGKSFVDFARADGVVLGAIVVGAVREIGPEMAYVRIGDVDAELQRREIAWGFRGHPEWLLSPGGAVTVSVIEVVEERCVVRVSMKRTRPSPWGMTWQPKRDDRVKGEVAGIDEQGNAHVRIRMPQGVDGEVYGLVPPGEWSWYSKGDPRYSAPGVGVAEAFRVVGALQGTDDIVLSRATLDARDWDTIGRRYPKGTKCRAKVIRVDHDGVRCELEHGVHGRIDRTELTAAGFEYADYTNTVVPGQSIDVVVIGQRSGRQFLKLDLQRNRSGEQPTVPDPSRSHA